MRYKLTIVVDVVVVACEADDGINDVAANEILLRK